MIVELVSDKLLVKIDSKGAELKSIIGNNVEYMWQGDKNSWKRTSPILFPIVGALNNDYYTLDDKKYKLTQHGFARDMDFTVIEQNLTSVMFFIQSNDMTRELYPWDFELFLGYELLDNTVKVSYKVVNKSTQEMLFSIGAHPGFNCPLDSELNFSDYKLVFNKKENAYRRFKNNRVMSGKRQRYLESNNRIDLEHSIFEDGAIIFDNLDSTLISLESEKDSKKVVMDFKGFPYFGIWSWPKGNVNYICLEPWFGIDSTVTDGPDLYDKEGLIDLDEGETFETFYTITIFS